MFFSFLLEDVSHLRIYIFYFDLINNVLSSIHIEAFYEKKQHEIL